MPRRPGPDLVLVPARLAGPSGRPPICCGGCEADVVLGFGGYVSTPVYLAARRLGVPIVIHEQNALPGPGQPAGRPAHPRTSTPPSRTPRCRTRPTSGCRCAAAITDLDRAAARAAGAVGRIRAPRPGPADPAGQRRLAGRAEHQPRGARRPGPAARAGIQVLHVLGPKNIDRRRRPARRPADRGGLPAGGLRRADGAGVRRRRPDARPLRRRHRAGDGGGRAAGGLRALPARQRRAGAQRRAGGARPAAALLLADADCTADWVATEVPALLERPGPARRE